MSQVTDIHTQSTPVADPESVVTLTARSLESGRTQQPTEEQQGRELRKTSQEVKTVAASHHHHHHHHFIDSDHFIINVVSGYLESVTVSVHALWQTGDLWQRKHDDGITYGDDDGTTDRRAAIYIKQCDDRNGPSPRTAGNRYLIPHFYRYDSSPEHRLYALT